MIVRPEADHLLLVRQADHAYLSGQLSAIWGSPAWAAPTPYPSVVLGARLHDEAWLPWDEAPALHPDGRPLNFHEVDRVTTARLYAAGIEAVARLDDFAGLMVGLHYSGFFHGHWEWQPFAKPERFAEPEAAALSAFVDAELGRQARLSAELGLDTSATSELAAAYRLLQLWDRISLDLCRQDPHAGWSTEYPPADSGGGALTALRIALPEPGVCLLDPYPLAVDHFHAQLRATRIPLERLDGFDLAWRRTPQVAIDITFRS